jgi:hypothetical protein
VPGGCASAEGRRYQHRAAFLERRSDTNATAPVGIARVDFMVVLDVSYYYVILTLTIWSFQWGSSREVTGMRAPRANSAMSSHRP